MDPSRPQSHSALPGPEHNNEHWDRQRLEQHYAPWIKLLATGTGVHCGEFGFFNKTPHAVGLAWLRDLLDILRTRQIGWALWNLTGSFGVLNSDRADIHYEEFQGHRLDRALLDLLRRS